MSNGGKRIKQYIFIFLLFILFFVFLPVRLTTFAQIGREHPSTDVIFVPCGCPDIKEASQYYTERGEVCVGTYDAWKTDPLKNHFWVYDTEITAQGKTDERARQFIYWVLNNNAIDNHPTLKTIWNYVRNIAYFFVILMTAILGIGFIVGQRMNRDFKLKIWPAILKIVMALLYISFSASIVLLFIQLSEILMKFFVETLGGRDLFNIYFGSAAGNEKNYSNFLGCRDLNVTVQEAIRSELFLLKITNVTYYVMGVMLLLRKILLWFLLFVSPFLAIFFSFNFIKNIGWIWVGVFFQWLFYGPLFAIFLYALKALWESGIPFPFDFSRINNSLGYVYPTGINILYGGPAQNLKFVNNGNYIDTFVEYVITLIMLWAVIVFPWWLLRIFRDYCCDGIYAMKNILMSLYDQARGTPSTPLSPSPTPVKTTMSTGLKMPQDIQVPVQIKLETIQEIKKTKTEDISKSLNLQATKLTDIARFETNKQTQETVRKNLDYLSNPTKAETPTERQKYMNIRTELFSRAIKEDVQAKQILSSISTSQVEQIQRRKEFIKSTPQASPAAAVTSVQTHIPQQTISSVSTSLINSLSTNTSLINSLSQASGTPADKVQTVLASYQKQVNQPITHVVANISKETGIDKKQITKIFKYVSDSKALTQAITSNTHYIESLSQTTNTPVSQVQNILTSYEKHIDQPVSRVVEIISKETGMDTKHVEQIIKTPAEVVSTQNAVIKDIAQKQNLSEQQVQNIIQTQTAFVVGSEQNIEQTISIPPSVSIEDYEEVKKMWTAQYEKGEVPVSENIASRASWVDQDIVFITNTLNKLLSSDETLRQQGVDDLGYILPIFLINNLKGEELVVYLKAKLEAAKSIKSQIEREKEITEKLKEKSEEELVEVNAPKTQEAEKTMEMKEELPDNLAKKEEKKELASSDV